VYSAPYVVSMNDIEEDMSDGACSMNTDVWIQTIARKICKYDVDSHLDGACTDGKIKVKCFLGLDWCSFLKKAIILKLLQRTKSLLTSWATISFSRRIQIYRLGLKGKPGFVRPLHFLVIRKICFIYESHRCTVHFVKSLQLLTNKCTYITFT